MIGIINQTDATRRETGNWAAAAGEGRSVLRRRVYGAPIEDVGSARTDPERIGRWLGPVEGDPRPGAPFRLKDDAGGEALRRAEPRVARATRALALLGVDLFPQGVRFDPATSQNAPKANIYAVRSCHARGPVASATSDDDIAAAIAVSVRHFAPEIIGDR